MKTRLTVLAIVLLLWGSALSAYNPSTLLVITQTITELQATLAKLIAERDRLLALQPVDATYSDWRLESATAWSACQNGTQTRTETWVRDQLTPAQNGGAEGPTIEARTGMQSCTVTPPPPSDGETNIWTVVKPTYSGAPLGGKLVPQLWQTGNGVDTGDQVVFTDRWYDTVRGINIYANGVFGFNPLTHVVDVLKLNNWRNNPCTQARVNAGECAQVGGYTSDKLPEWEADPTPVDSHPLAGLAFDPVSRSVLDINGANTSAFTYYPDGDMFETWRMPLNTRTWTKVADGEAGDPHPPKDIDDYACAVSLPGQTVYFDVTNAATETWVFDFLTNRWSKRPVAESAKGIRIAVAGCAYDAKRHRILVLGGGRSLYQPVNTDPSRQKLRAYSLVTNEWSELAAPPVIPIAPEFAYSDVDDIALALIREKQADGTTRFDTYAYLATTDTWERLAKGFNRGPLNINGHAGTLTYHKASGLFVSHGGVWNAPVFATLKYRSSVQPQPPPTDTDPTPEPDPDPEPPPVDPLNPHNLLVVGRGCTSVWFIDEDCDGYGVGVRTSGHYGVSLPGLGDKPDADDTQPFLNTAASVTAAYDADADGTLSAAELKTFLSARRGYVANRIFYIAPDGDNATGAPDDVSRPFRSYLQTSGTAGLRRLLKPGDVVVWRAGTYTEKLGSCCPYLASGAAGAPIVLMAAPGESVRFNTLLVSTFGAHHLLLDGFTQEYTASPLLGNGLVVSESQDITIRHYEIQRFNFPTGMQNLQRVTVERSLFHHMYEHGLYLGSREKPNTDITVTGSIFYGNGVTTSYGAFQHNGRVTNLRVEGNILHSNGQWGISFAQGVADSLVANNLIFNNAGNAIIFQLYAREPSDVENCANGTLLICPYAQTGNLITNNTIWVGRSNLKGSAGDTSLRTAILVGRNDLPAAPQYSQGHNTVQNNILVTDAGPVMRDLDAESFATWTVRNNVLFRRAGETSSMAFGSTFYSLEGFQQAFAGAVGNRFADPLVTAESVDWWGTPERFDFHVLEGSPAIGLGVTTGAPSTDLQGRARTAPIDAGAYRK